VETTATGRSTAIRVTTVEIGARTVWSQNHKNYGNGWSGYNNNWNKNWDRRACVRNWNPQPYYGEFIGGVFLGSILAANGVGVVPYAPEPYLCWYWADPYMIRGYWDYCY